MTSSASSLAGEDPLTSDVGSTFMQHGVPGRPNLHQLLFLIANRLLRRCGQPHEAGDLCPEGLLACMVVQQH